MNRIFIFLMICSLTGSAMAKNIEWTTASLKMSVDDKGNIISLYDRVNNKEYLAPGKTAPLMSIRVNGAIENPSALRQKGNIIMLEYSRSKVEAHITVNKKPGYLTFELTAISPKENVELVIWGPYPVNIRETVGECVGVVRNNDYAIGIQALNTKTLGGYPTEENDIEPSFDIFQTDNYTDITPDWKKKKLYRGQTAKLLDDCSVVQAYCRNRSAERIISNWAHPFYVAPAFNDGGVVGSKIALFGCRSAEALETIGKIEIAEGLPHPMIDGEWGKTAGSATASYLIISFSEADLDRALELTKKAGLKYLYHGDPFTTWGHFRLNEKYFPDDRESMKRCVERASKEGIRLGVHTLSNFITTNDPYVTPLPDERLARVGESTLTNDLDAGAEEIFIESPEFFNQMQNNTLHSVVIGNEIIRYKEVTAVEPWKLTGCVRGTFGTKAESHKKGDKIGKLMDHPYKVFLSNASLSEEISKNIAGLFNETGLMQTSFDGLEGVWSSGMGQYARILFTKTWFDNLKPELQGKVINDASNPAHFNWHINTRYNWGEPWYAGFRESQTSYRLMNQDFYRRNLLPSMLGWFSMTAQTSLEDTEWLLARAAGFDAGFAFNLNYRNVANNAQSDLIFGAIKTWETARMAGAFTPEQKLKMEDINNEFHLVSAGEGTWDLYPYHISRFVHEQKVRQPGEPVHSIFEFDNPYEKQSLKFIITLLPGKENNVSSVGRISIGVNNYDTFEIPVKLEASQVLKLDDKGELKLYDKNWNLLQTINTNGKIPELSNGGNKVIIDADFAEEGSAQLKIEMKTIGKAERITAVK